jgi:hypothetical protein
MVLADLGRNITSALLSLSNATVINKEVSSGIWRLPYQHICRDKIYCVYISYYVLEVVLFSQSLLCVCTHKQNDLRPVKFNSNCLCINRWKPFGISSTC